MVGLSQALRTEVEKHGLQKVFRRVESLDPTAGASLTAALVSECLERCATDGLFWLQFVSTRDEADPDQSVKPFPVHLEYIRELWDVLVRDQRVVIAKSRQMLVSWLVCAFCVWWARFRPHQAIYWQSQQWIDACAMIATASGRVQGRCQFIEKSLPPWMQQKYTTLEGCISYENGSMIQSLAGGAEQIRGKVASIIVEDEFAKQSEATGVWATVAPLIQKGARIIVVGTPNGTDNMFATVYHGRPMGTERP